MSGGALRAATPDDAEAVSAVIIAALRGSNAADYSPTVIERVAAGFAPDRVRALIAARRTLVAVRGGAVVGTAALDGAALRSVFVHPEAQRLGIGAALVAEVARMAEAGGEAEMTLQSSLTAAGFYARLGFERVGDRWDGEERTVVMRGPTRRLAARARCVGQSAAGA